MTKTTFKQDLKHIKDKWLLLSISALLAAGLLTFIIVFSRTPFVKDFFIFKDLFNKALVIHVDLSQLFWFLALGLCLSFNYLEKLDFIRKFTFKIALASLFGLILSPFLPSEAILNNYIPVINNLLFFLSLSLYLSIIIITSITSSFLNRKYFLRNTSIEKNYILSFNIVIIIAFINFFPALEFIKQHEIQAEFYEILFWGFGHILQYAYVILMVLGWHLSLRQAKLKISILDHSLKINLLLYSLIALYSLVIFTLSTPSIAEFKDFYTAHMIYGSSFLPLIFLFFASSVLCQKKFYSNSKENRVLLNCFIGSSLLFVYGGLLGSKITISNTLIPAHYHGSTVAVTISLIAITYILLPKFGGKKIDSKLAIWQPIIYATGQIIHITGLAISGGYGALRKSPDSIQGFSANFWMGIMGFGGLITMLAGLMFLIICYKSIRRT